MELKDFQDRVLTTLSEYLSHLDDWQRRAAKIIAANEREDDPELKREVPDFTTKAWAAMKNANRLPASRASIPFSSRSEGASRPVPSVCLKIPTGGGKTLLATHGVSHILGQWVRSNAGFVLWIVPNESIYTQTMKALRNREHPFRQVLDRAAAGRVKIMDKNERLDRRDVEEQLCVMLLMLQSANRESKESLRLFKDRGNVHGFFPVSDDVPAHWQCLETTPNLDVYGERENMGAIVKDSLGNVLRVIRPIVVLDEGHRGYSRLAMDTLYGFNPRFVLELTATPVDRTKDTPPTYSNWLVDVRGTDLDREGMVKLPINVTVHGASSWRDCLRESVDQLNRLQADADSLSADSSRYIRPICLIQVERTGKDQRDGEYIHAEDARDYLLTLGVQQQAIAIKTSEKNELNQPENLDLLSPANQVRFIITKQALQEGWDCPFAYVLCSLAPVTGRGAMTQLLGRILRQPDTLKTGRAALDECYVFCHHATTREVVATIKQGLESDGMGDLTGEVRDSGGGEGTVSGPRKLGRRAAYRNLEIYLPLVLRVDEDSVRPLDYEADILYRLDWSQVSVAKVAQEIPADVRHAQTHFVVVGLAKDPKNLIDTDQDAQALLAQPLDAAYVTRAIVDIVPNPWVGRAIVENAFQSLRKKGFDEERLAATQSLIVQTLRNHLEEERDGLAEELFTTDVEAGRIQFRLRTDRSNWNMPDHAWTQQPSGSARLIREDDKEVDKSLFEPAYRDDLNSYEQRVACYLDEHQALKWWHRNVAKAQGGYSMQGWRKHRVYPDFVFALSKRNRPERLVVLETKGDHLDNPDTAYKKRLLERLTDAFSFETTSSVGELEIEGADGVIVSCKLILESEWRTELPIVLSE